MKKLISILTFLVCWSAMSQTNFTTTSTNLGTKLTIPVTTSAFWRAILPDETLTAALSDMGLTNYNGTIVTIASVGNGGGAGSTNHPVSLVVSPDQSINVLLTTNLDGSLTASITANSNIITTVVNQLGTNLVTVVETNILPVLSTNGFDDTAVQDGFIFQPTAQGSPSNTYVLDGKQTNVVGQKLVSGELTPTNDAYFSGIANFRYGSMLSIEVMASNGNRIVSFPTNLFINASGSNMLSRSDGVCSFTNVGALWQLTVTNGHELILGVRSNHNGMETLWHVTP